MVELITKLMTFEKEYWVVQLCSFTNYKSCPNTITFYSKCLCVCECGENASHVDSTAWLKSLMIGFIVWCYTDLYLI
jgi:hypothetical protein